MLAWPVVSAPPTIWSPALDAPYEKLQSWSFFVKPLRPGKKAAEWKASRGIRRLGKWLTGSLNKRC